MRVGDIITDGSVKWVVRHIDHPKAGVIVDWQSAASMGDGFLKCTGAGIDPNIYPLLKNILPLVGGKLILPDRRGVVPRGLDDGRGLDVGRVLGSFQEDAIRNITGSFQVHTNGYAKAYSAKGAFYAGNRASGLFANPNTTSTTYEIETYLDVSRVTQTSIENRMKNVATTYWICYA